MKLYKRVAVNGSSNEETLEEVVTSTSEEPKHITAIWFNESTGTLQSNAILRAYVERERIIDFDFCLFHQYDAGRTRIVKPRLEVDIDLPVGQSLTVGHVSAGTASNFEIVAEYEITS